MSAVLATLGADPKPGRRQRRSARRAKAAAQQVQGVRSVQPVAAQPVGAPRPVPVPRAVLAPRPATTPRPPPKPQSPPGPPPIEVEYLFGGPEPDQITLHSTIAVLEPREPRQAQEPGVLDGVTEATKQALDRAFGALRSARSRR